MEEFRLLVKQLIQANAKVYGLLLEWVEPTLDDGLMRSATSTTKPPDMRKLKREIEQTITELGEASKSIDKIKPK